MQDLIHVKDKICKFCGHEGLTYNCLPDKALPGETTKWYKGCNFCHNREEIDKSIADEIWTVAMSKQIQEWYW